MLRLQSTPATMYQPVRWSLIRHGRLVGTRDRLEDWDDEIGAGHGLGVGDRVLVGSYAGTVSFVGERGGLVVDLDPVEGEGEGQVDFSPAQALRLAEYTDRATRRGVRI